MTPGGRAAPSQQGSERPVDGGATACNQPTHALATLVDGRVPDQRARLDAIEGGRVTRSQASRAPLDPASASIAPGIEPATRSARPSATRSASARKVRHVQELRRGRVQAMQHGIYARVANLPDVATEVALQMALRPGLDAMRDLRLVESFAMASVQLRRAHEAIESKGLTEHLGAFIGRHGPLVERLERELHEREQERLAAHATAASDRFAAYRSGGGAS